MKLKKWYEKYADYNCKYIDSIYACDNSATDFYREKIKKMDSFLKNALAEAILSLDDLEF